MIERNQADKELLLDIANDLHSSKALSRLADLLNSSRSMTKEQIQAELKLVRDGLKADASMIRRVAERIGCDANGTIVSK